MIGLIRELSSQSFTYLNLLDDIANSVLVKFFKASYSTDQAAPSTEYIMSVFPKAIEEVFNYYQKVSYQYCYSKTYDHVLSEDTSQEAIRQMLSSKSNIKEIYPWLRKVTHNLLCKYYENRVKERELFDKLSKEASVFQSFISSEQGIQISGLNPSLKQEILDSPEYKVYEQAISFSNIRDYAAWLKVSDKVAQKRKERAVRDLRSKILLAMGWEASRDILNYNQYNAIQKFNRELLRVGCGSGDGDDGHRWIPNLRHVMHGIERIDDWGITMVGNRKFRLHVFHLTQDKRPLIATFFIVLDERNHITVEDSKKHENIRSYTIPANVQIPKEMGKSLWSYEKIISLLNA